ncbi:paired mesoderm homeobox protein 2-like [Oncorhynchus tshawytscha]|uniref:Homeobox domain-containing protein n=1 Tax=Oncorhynchus tshawytscha TaxID=74940 RepID=A0A8C8FRM8_ONCTS|nr:paired mesoderm homeobox protein 2-like [Oncorhynchus tshawytscha]
MWGHFSIEWLAQSSQALGSMRPSPLPSSWSSVGPNSTSVTQPESLPGFYCRPRPKNQENQARRGQRLNPFSYPCLAGPEMCTHTKRSSPLHHNHQEVAETGFISRTEGTSGYESECGRSLSPTTPPDGTFTSPSLSPISLSLPTGKRRTAYKAEQINSLETAFKRNAYLGTQDKAELCKRLNLTDKQIRNWFQNRRMRMKRMVQDALAQACQAKVTSHLLHYTELQAYRPGPNPTYHPYHAGAEGGTSTPYLHNQYSSSMAGPALPSLPATPMDSLYQYVSLPGLVMPTPRSNPLMGAYQPHSHLC